MKSMTRDLASLGLPPLPGLSAAAAPTRPNDRSLSAKAVKTAIRGVAKPERKGLEVIDAVCGLLRMYDAVEMDQLLLDCDERERRFLLGCLMKS